MRELMGIHVGNIVEGKEEVFLCFDWEQHDEKGASHIKVRYGNRKFFTTLFKTKDAGSIMLLRWKNDINGHCYEMKKPEISRNGDLIRVDLTKEFAAMGMKLREDNESNQKAQRGGGSSHFYAESMWIHIGEQGYYYAERARGENSRDYLNFCFAYPGVKIGNSLVSKIEIDTFDSIRNENMDPLYDFMNTVMDEMSAVSRYTEREVAELFTKHFPITVHIDIWCNDKLLRASIDHLGIPQRWFTRQDIVDGVRDCNSRIIESKSPLDMIVKELGL
ncbi:MAG: hypothetical protein SPF70_11160 [Lachnospiraceae bacterium]|nr:hypothetical protein [Lachnospiraceae bacterium]